MDGPDATVPETGISGDCIDLRLYVAGPTPRCLAAYRNLVRICEAYAGSPYRITVIDLAKNPALAREEEITAIPTLVRLSRKERPRKIIGTLSDEKKVIGELGLAGQRDGAAPAMTAL